jgi:hypothetical protein
LYPQVRILEALHCRTITVRYQVVGIVGHGGRRVLTLLGRLLKQMTNPLRVPIHERPCSSAVPRHYPLDKEVALLSVAFMVMEEEKIFSAPTERNQGSREANEAEDPFRFCSSPVRLVYTSSSL